MIDMKARGRLAEAVRALVTGQITNDEFEARVPRTDDLAVSEIFSRGLWFLYGDLSEHKLKGNSRLSAEGRLFAARCIVFLKSGQEYTWPRERGWISLLKVALGLVSLGLIPWLLQEECQECWPFSSDAAWEVALKKPVYL
jgi:hypothetical protein